MKPSYALVTGPTSEPLTLADAKAQARISDDASNSLLLSYIKTAREAAEASLNYGIYTQTWKLVLGGFADDIALPMALVLQSVTSVQYYDTAGVQQTLSSTYYTVDSVSRPGRIVRAPGMAWPAVQADRLSGAVTITYVVGWSTVDAIPQRIKQGMRFYVTYLDLDRDGMEPNAMAAWNAAESSWTDKLYWSPPCDEWHREIR